MTHDELLAKILETGAIALQSSTLGGGWIYDAKTNALRAVVELHKPWEGEYFDKAICMACTPDIYVYEYYPCKTIQAIQEQLK